MTPKYCPKCLAKPEKRSIFVHHGVYSRSSDKKKVRRYYCKVCCKTFSMAAFYPFYRSKVRHHRKRLRNLLCSNVSQRRAAKKFLKVSRTTVSRMFVQEACVAEFEFNKRNAKTPLCSVIQFDDMETFEHSKGKPLSISLAVEEGTRRILGLTVSEMAANGRWAEGSRRKYGPRIDARSAGREELFAKIKPLVKPNVLIKTDENPHYPRDIKRHFPLSTHHPFQGRRAAATGQGELKKVMFDPIFSLNHTCAMFRANVNRLIRKTWCTTKKADRLHAHLMLYANFHNSEVIPSKFKT